MEYRSVEEIMAEFGAKGKENDPSYLRDVLVRIDAKWREAQDEIDDRDSAAEDKRFN